MKVIRVKLGEKSHEIKIGKGLLRHLPKWLGPAKKRSVVVLADRKLIAVARALEKQLALVGFEVHLLLKKSDESLKSWKSVGTIYDELSKLRVGRNALLIALGGGVIGDVAGFVAGTYLRGIDWINIPTTLLAQVDSAVGGKTGINLKAGKNLVGLFNQPSLVVCDVELLKTLPNREMQSGMGEVLKYGLLTPGIRTRNSNLENLIYQCLRIKVSVIESDERETRGVREVLNLGHTFAHAIEAATGFKRYRHGEAVYLGLRAAIELSMIRGHLSDSEASRLKSELPMFDLPALPRQIRVGQLISWMMSDKKAVAGRPKFVLLRGRGLPILDSAVTDKEIEKALVQSGVI